MEFVGCRGFVRKFVDVMVECFRVLDSGGNNIVLVVQFGEEVIPLHTKLPRRPSPTWIVHLGQVGLGKGRRGLVERVDVKGVAVVGWWDCCCKEEWENLVYLVEKSKMGYHGWPSRGMAVKGKSKKKNEKRLL